MFYSICKIQEYRCFKFSNSCYTFHVNQIFFVFELKKYACAGSLPCSVVEALFSYPSVFAFLNRKPIMCILSDLKQHNEQILGELTNNLLVLFICVSDLPIMSNIIQLIWSEQIGYFKKVFYGLVKTDIKTIEQRHEISPDLRRVGIYSGYPKKMKVFSLCFSKFCYIPNILLYNPQNYLCWLLVVQFMPTLRKKCLDQSFLWSVFSYIRRRITP